MEPLRLYILGINNDFQGNRWREDVRDAAERLGWTVIHRGAQGAPAEEVVSEASGCDLFLWLRANRHEPLGNARAMLRRIEERTPTIGLHMDLYWGIQDREPLVNPFENPWWSCQYVFTADGGNQERFSKLGINHQWMPPAMGDRFFGLVPGDRHVRPYVFVGSNSRSLHGSDRGNMLAWAARRYGRQFRHHGEHSAVTGERLNHIYAGARVVLGDSAKSNMYWSDRIPTTMGRGGVLAHPRTPGLELHGYDEQSLILYDRNSFEDLGLRMDSMSDDELSRMREAALAVTWDRHMWRHRLESIARIALS